MARKTKKEAQETRENILDAAEDCFLEHGLSRTGLEAIAARAGVTRGAVYWHFKNKDEVLEAMVNRVTVPFLHGLERVSRAEGTTPLRDLRELLRQSFADLGHDGRMRNALEVIELRSEIASEGDAISTLRQAGMRRTHARILAAFARAAVLDQLRDGVTAEHSARSLHFMIFGALRMYLLDPTHIDLERDGLAAVDLVLRAVARDPGLLDVPR
ncbi:MAG TPA: TetR family transcriptional regulator [Luteimonas sp.]|nr:TetR family transcriptional regulator [Luteimonas sp.]HRO27617.1 TetR family transcriptional regulator [Luteimonas sp.]HRP72268.1 TetR family transcriptional regulator [Luteimonas sp.]